MVSVKLCVIPGATAEYILEPGATIASLLDVAGKDGSSYAIKLNNASAAIGTELTDGAIVTLSKSATGNA